MRSGTLGRSYSTIDLSSLRMRRFYRWFSCCSLLYFQWCLCCESAAQKSDMPSGSAKAEIPTEPDTRVPEPTRAASRPSYASPSYAESTVLRETLSALARMRLEGRRVPPGIIPHVIMHRSARWICLSSVTREGRSSAMKGTTTLATRFKMALFNRTSSRNTGSSDVR